MVASEVRTLAQRSAEAAKEIKSLISTSVERVEQGTQLVDQAGTTMAEIVSAIRRVTDIMGEISAASSEQSQGVAQVGEAVTQMDQTTQQNAALVEESAAAAGALRKQAHDLVQAVAVFQLPASAMQDSAAVARHQAPARIADTSMSGARTIPRAAPRASAHKQAAAVVARVSAAPILPVRSGVDAVVRKTAKPVEDNEWETF